MRSYRQLIIYGFVAVTAAFFASCEEDTETDADDLAIPLTADARNIKAPGKGQYRLSTISAENVAVKAEIPSSEVKSFTITKKVNLVADPQFGQNGVLTVSPSSFSSEYVFNYTATTTDVDQLVGFTFRVEKNDGSVQESDLTLVVTLSPRDNLPRRKWELKSLLWVTGDNLEAIQDCEKDNYYLFNTDKTLSLKYGAKACTAGCDGCWVEDTWELSDDEKTFTIKLHNVFAPDQTRTDVYRVKTLTTEKLELEIDYDFGAPTLDTFLYVYAAAPR
jgi:hypothetical protein